MPVEPIRRGDSARVLRGKIVAAFVSGGWRPPPMNDFQAQRLLDDIASVHPGATLELTDHELRSLQLAANGLTQQAIAAELEVSNETVKEITARIRDKLGANNTTEAVAIAYREGLIE